MATEFACRIGSPSGCAFELDDWQVRPAIERTHHQSQLRHAFYLEMLEDRMVLVVFWLGSRLESIGISCRDAES
jgi:hypothetical protein